MALDFPNSPVVGDIFTAGNMSWEWNGTTWRLIGAGIVGVQGIQGLQGLQGLQGSQGTQGTAGYIGADGSQGLTGIQGTQGATGAQGIQGIQGTQGVQGVQGNTGVQGIVISATPPANTGVLWMDSTTSSTTIQGTTGSQGTTGIQGIQGITGSAGVQGTQGVQGIQGPNGPTSLGLGVATNNIPTANGLSFNSHSYIFDDGNMHVTASGGTIWINSNDGADVQINKQSPANGGLQVGGTITSANIADSGWIQITSFTNNFAVAGNNVYYRRLNGVLYMRGSISGGTAGTAAFTLPSGYRPSATGTYAVQQYGTASINYITINTDGTVVPAATSTWLTGATVPLN